MANNITADKFITLGGVVNLVVLGDGNLSPIQAVTTDITDSSGTTPNYFTSVKTVSTKIGNLAILNIYVEFTIPSDASNSSGVQNFLVNRLDAGIYLPSDSDFSFFLLCLYSTISSILLPSRMSNSELYVDIPSNYWKYLNGDNINIRIYSSRLSSSADGIASTWFTVMYTTDE